MASATARASLVAATSWTRRIAAPLTAAMAAAATLPMAALRLAPCCLSDERLARRADDEGPPELGELAQTAEQEEVVLCSLGEAQAGIDRDPVFRDAGRTRSF